MIVKKHELENKSFKDYMLKKIKKIALVFFSLILIVFILGFGTVLFMRAAFLRDFDYMITTLEENFPSFGIIYRRNGVDWLTQAEIARANLSGRLFINTEIFIDVLQRDFLRYMFPVGGA